MLPTSGYQAIPKSGEPPAKAGVGKRFFAVLFAAVALVSLAGVAIHGQQDPAKAREALVKAHVSTPACLTTAGGAIERGKKLFDATFHEEMILQFSFTATKETRFGNVVWVGDQNDNEFPAVFFSNKLGHDSRLIFKFDKEGAADQYFYKELAVQPDTEYEVRIHVQGLTCKVYLDGAMALDFEIPEQFKPDAAAALPVYASAPFSLAAEGSVSKVALCTGGTQPASLEDCQSFGAVDVYKGHLIGSAPIVRDGVWIEMKLTVDRIPGYWCSLLHFGDTARRRQPLVDFNPDNQLRVAFAGENYEAREAISIDGIPEGQPITLQIIRDELHATVLLDWQVIGEIPLGEEDVPETCTPEDIFMGRGGTAPAIVTVEDVTVCNYVSTQCV